MKGDNTLGHNDCHIQQNSTSRLDAQLQTHDTPNRARLAHYQAMFGKLGITSLSTMSALAKGEHGHGALYDNRVWRQSQYEMALPACSHAAHFIYMAITAIKPDDLTRADDLLAGGVFAQFTL